EERGNAHYLIVESAEEIGLEEVAPLLSELSESLKVVGAVSESDDAASRFAEHHLSDPLTVEPQEKRGLKKAAKPFEFQSILTSEGIKTRLATELLSSEATLRTLVFCRRATAVDDLVEAAEEKGDDSSILIEALDERTEEGAERSRAAIIKRWREGEIAALALTDVTAPTLEELGVSGVRVLHRDLPFDRASLIHRLQLAAEPEDATPTSIYFVGLDERPYFDELCAGAAREAKPIHLSTNSLSSKTGQAVKRIESFKNSIRKALAGQDLDLELRLVHELAEEGGHDLSDVAAALIRVARADDTLDDVDLIPARPRAQAKEVQSDDGFGPPRERPTGPQQGVEEGMVRIAVNCGRWCGLRPADLVRTFAEVCDFPGSEVGAIKIFDRFALVDVPKEREDVVLERMPGTELRGRTVAVRIDDGRNPEGDSGGGGGRGGYGGGRSNYGDRDRGGYGGGG
ncbi:MAG: DbpA RNA binding domain-containing protein, partial [Planctomycetota bacterium]